MGYSIGRNFKDLDGNEFHVEAKDTGVAIWSKDELHRFLFLSNQDAEDLGEELVLHANLGCEKTDK